MYIYLVKIEKIAEISPLFSQFSFKNREQIMLW